MTHQCLLVKTWCFLKKMYAQLSDVLRHTVFIRSNNHSACTNSESKTQTPCQVYLRLVVIRPATTQANRGSAVKLTAVKKIVEAAKSTAAGFQLQQEPGSVNGQASSFCSCVNRLTEQAERCLAKLCAGREHHIAHIA